MVAAALAVVAAVCFLVGMLGGDLGSVDLGSLGLMFLALAVAALALLPWPRRRV